ncbi:MAG: TrmH family RNA methyltransferase [Xanthobacteraceae bacterium]
MRRALTTSELRCTKPTREQFLTQPRRPITVVLDGVIQNYNIGAVFRLCDGFLVQQLLICGTKLNLHKRRLVQAAQGTQHWVPWRQRQHAADATAEAKARGAWVVVAKQTTASVRPEELVPMFPACLVLGAERNGVPLLRSRCSAWRTRSMSRRPLPSCCIGFQRALKTVHKSNDYMSATS